MTETMIHDFEAGTIRCEDCFEAARDRGDIPRRKIFDEDEEARSGERFRRDSSGTAFCEDCS